MALSQKEMDVIKDLQTQEQCCIEKYKRYEKEAKDPVLKGLFGTLAQKEQQQIYDAVNRQSYYRQN